MFTQADQGITGALARATAAEMQGLDIEQAYGVFVIQAMQYGLVVQTEQFLGFHRVGQSLHVVPAFLTLLDVLLAIGGQLLHQQATGTDAIGGEGNAGVDLLGHDEIVGETLRQVLAVQLHRALVALTVDRNDGQDQMPARHQVGKGRIIFDLLGHIACQAANLVLAGAFDGQQRHRPARLRLKDQQAIELQRADQQRGSRHQLAEQLRDRLRVRMLGQHFGVAALQPDHFTAYIAVVEDEALGVIGIRQFRHGFGFSRK
ncbi:hypothetical protein D3C75_784520 [compost metagenome]